MIISRTPLRISLIGGGTDVPAFYEKHPGCVVSFAINKYIYIMVNPKFDETYRVSYSQTENVEKISQIQHNLVRTSLDMWKSSSGGTGWDKFSNGLEIVSISDIPGLGSGLGSSSSFTVGILNAFKELQYGRPFSSETILANYAFDVESRVHPNIGKQDHYAASFGGFNRFDFRMNNDLSEIIITKVKSKWDCDNPWSWNELHENMLLLWTGMSRKSDDLLKWQREGFDSGGTLEIGKDLAHLANSCYINLTDGKIEDAAKDIHAGWHLKRRLAKGITNEWVDDWYQKAMNNGAWGGKLCGAGGGGFMFFFAPPDTHDRIVQATELRKIDFNIDTEGSVIIRREGHGDF